MSATAVLERARAAGFPSVAVRGGYMSIGEGEAEWQSRLSTATPAEISEADRLLGEYESRLHSEADEVERQARLSAPPDPALIQAAEAEARAHLERYEKARPERIERLLERIADSLDSARGK